MMALLLLLGGALSLVFVLSRHERESFVMRNGAELANAARLNGEHLRKSMDSMRNEVLFLSHTPPVQGILRAALNKGFDPLDGNYSHTWENRLNEIYSAFAANHHDYYQIRYIGLADGGRELVRVDILDGRPVATPKDKLQRKGDRDYFQATLKLREGEVYISEINLNQEHGKVEIPHKPTWRAATPVFTHSGEMFGMIVINRYASQVLENLKLWIPPYVRVYLANMEGDYLLHPDAGRMFGFDLGRRYRWEHDFPGMSIEPRSLDETAPLQTVDTIEGTSYVAARKIFFDPLRPDRFLTLIYALPRSAIEERISSTNFKIIAGAFVFTLAAAGAVIVILLWMFAPLQRITEAAAAIADGHYDTPLPAVRGGEIAALTSAFQLMVARVRQRERDLITLNQELDHKVEERTAQLRAANKELSEFASVASHDLQEPLRTIVAFSERLRDKHAAELSPKAQDYLARISKGGERMSFLIHDILDYSRASSAAARRERVDMNHLLDALLTDMKAALTESGGAVERDPLPELLGDQTLIAQLFQNLVSNALKYRKPDTPPRIRVRWLRAESGLDDAVIAVEDNGIGFEPKYAERIFNMFERLHSRSEYDGTGIGLATARKIAEREGGGIWAQGSPGEGATFYVRLPLWKTQ